MRIAQMLALAMLFGSIPFRYAFCRKNAENRTLDAKARMALVALLDIAKGFLPVFLAKGMLQSDYWIISVGIVAILSHCFPYWLMFKPNGTAVLPGLGVVLALNSTAGIIASAVYGISLLIFRKSFIAVIIAAVSVPILFRVLGTPVAYIVFGLLGMAYVVLVHVPNIALLINGTEPKG